MSDDKLVNRELLLRVSLFLFPLFLYLLAAVLISGNCVAAAVDAFDSSRGFAVLLPPRRGNNIASSVIYKPAIYRR